MKVILSALALALAAGLQADSPQDRLYGRVLTAAGRVHEGFLRWDRNEGSWADVLDGSKELPWENLREAERLDEEYGRRRARERSIEVLGVRITWDEDDGAAPQEATSGIRFGHLRSLRVAGRDRAHLTLKSGAEVDLSGGSTDIGSNLRGLVVEESDGGTVELRWRDIDEVEFMEAPRAARVPGAERLHGTVRTRLGHELTGYIAWDADEILGSDVLDGSEDGRDLEIPFERIAVIERVGSRSARVVLTDGEEHTLRGTNDVNSSNRGIGVSDPGLGQVSVPWNELESVTFHPPEATDAPYSTFDGGRPLRGTVVTRDGERLTGLVRWDNDEEASWELLDGRDGRVDFDVELGLIDRIVRRASWGVEVTLADGRVFELEGSNDVDDRNKGLFLTLDDGEQVLVRWLDFEEVVFER